MTIKVGRGLVHVSDNSGTMCDADNSDVPGDRMLTNNVSDNGENLCGDTSRLRPRSCER